MFQSFESYICTSLPYVQWNEIQLNELSAGLTRCFLFHRGTRLNNLCKLQENCSTKNWAYLWFFSGLKTPKITDCWVCAIWETSLLITYLVNKAISEVYNLCKRVCCYCRKCDQCTSEALIVQTNSLYCLGQPVGDFPAKFITINPKLPEIWNFSEVLDVPCTLHRYACHMYRVIVSRPLQQDIL